MEGEPNGRAPGQDVLGALFLYVVIAIAYGVWSLTHDPRWAHASSLGSGAFLEHCLTWPRLISAGVKQAVVGSFVRRAGNLPG